VCEAVQLPLIESPSNHVAKQGKEQIKNHLLKSEKKSANLTQIHEDGEVLFIDELSSNCVAGQEE
jgi:hypothetical protein